MPADDFMGGAQYLVALVRADLAKTAAPEDVRTGLVAASLLRTAELLEHLLVASENDSHLPAQMLFRAIVDSWLGARYLMEGPDDVVDRMRSYFDAKRQQVGELTGLEVPGDLVRQTDAKRMPQALQVASYLDELDGLSTSEQPVRGAARWWYGWAYMPMSDSAVHSGYGALTRYIEAGTDGFEFVSRPDPLIPATRCFRLSLGAAANLLCRAYPYLKLDTSRIGDLEHMQIALKR